MPSVDQALMVGLMNSRVTFEIHAAAIEATHCSCCNRKPFGGWSPTKIATNLKLGSPHQTCYFMR